jgi:hypothetical protein
MVVSPKINSKKSLVPTACYLTLINGSSMTICVATLPILKVKLLRANSSITESPTGSSTKTFKDFLKMRSNSINQQDIKKQLSETKMGRSTLSTATIRISKETRDSFMKSSSVKKKQGLSASKATHSGCRSMNFSNNNKSNNANSRSTTKEWGSSKKTTGKMTKLARTSTGVQVLASTILSIRPLNSGCVINEWIPCLLSTSRPGLFASCSYIWCYYLCGRYFFHQGKRTTLKWTTISKCSCKRGSTEWDSTKKDDCIKTCRISWCRAVGTL